ncbi:DUF6056 family protein [Adhaeribacter radiodurans]|nr:DUF6056 family protein [Adhaeribacter radiodurans]
MFYSLLANKLNRLVSVNGALLVLGLALLPFLLLAAFCHPSADDFWLTNLVIAKGPWQAQLAIRQNWSGRYTAMFLGSFNPLVYRSIALYKVLPVIFLILLTAGLYNFVKVLSHSGFSRKITLAFALLILIMYLHQMPTVAQTIYWMSGAITYQSANILLLYLLILLIRYYQPFPGNHTLLRKLLITLLVVAVIGCNETSMAMLVFLLVCFFLLFTYQHRTINYFLLWLLVVATAACSLVIFAPGNSVREHEYSLRHDFWYAAGHALVIPLNNALNWLLNSPLLLISVLLFPFAGKWLPKAQLFPRVHPLLATLILYGCLASGYFVAYWSKHMPAPPRVQDTIFFVFLIGWMLNLVIWSQYLRQRYELPRLPNYITSMLLTWGMLFLFFSKQSNIQVAYSDLLSGKAVRYNQEMQTRYVTLITSNCQVCPIKTVKNRLQTIFFEEVPADTSWENTYYAQYFGKKLLLIAE